MNSREYLEWILAQKQADFSITEENNDTLVITDELCEGKLQIWHLETDVVEMHLRRKEDGKDIFFLHFELKDDEHAKQLYEELIGSLRRQKERKTVKVLLSCTSGLTTSFFAEKLQEAARTLSLDYRFQAVPFPQLYSEGLKHDVILLAPQIAYEYDKVSRIFCDRIVRKIPASMFAAYDAGSVIDELRSELNRTAEEQKEQETAQIMHEIDTALSIYVINLTYDPEETRCICRLYEAGNVVRSDTVIKQSTRMRDIEDILDTLFAECRRHHRIDAVALSLPGVFHEGDAVLRIDYEDIASRVRELCGLPAFVCNNTTAVAYGFYAQQKEYQNIVYHSQPHGRLIGGQGMVFRGEPVIGSHAMAGEFEPLFLLLHGRKEGDGGTVEELRNAQLQYLTAAITVADPQVILIRNMFTPDAEEIRSDLAQYISEKYMPQIICVRNIDEYAYLGTMLYGVWQYKKMVEKTMEGTE